MAERECGVFGQSAQQCLCERGDVHVVRGFFFRVYMFTAIAPDDGVVAIVGGKQGVGELQGEIGLRMAGGKPGEHFFGLNDARHSPFLAFSLLCRKFAGDGFAVSQAACGVEQLCAYFGRIAEQFGNPDVVFFGEGEGQSGQSGGIFFGFGH